MEDNRSFVNGTYMFRISEHTLLNAPLSRDSLTVILPILNDEDAQLEIYRSTINFVLVQSAQ